MKKKNQNTTSSRGGSWWRTLYLCSYLGLVVVINIHRLPLLSPQWLALIEKFTRYFFIGPVDGLVSMETKLSEVGRNSLPIAGVGSPPWGESLRGSSGLRFRRSKGLEKVLTCVLIPVSSRLAGLCLVSITHCRRWSHSRVCVTKVPSGGLRRTNWVMFKRPCVNTLINPSVLFAC